MSRERELLQRALRYIEDHHYDSVFVEEVRAELQKPEPVASLVAEIKHGDFVPFDNLPTGKYKLIVMEAKDE